jgi:hypothetical protein
MVFSSFSLTPRTLIQSISRDSHLTPFTVEPLHGGRGVPV